MTINIPWTETALVFLFVTLSISVNSLRFKPWLLDYVAKHSWVQFLIVFLSAFFATSIRTGKPYTLTIRVIMALLVAITIQLILNTTTTSKKVETDAGKSG